MSRSRWAGLLLLFQVVALALGVGGGHQGYRLLASCERGAEGCRPLVEAPNSGEAATGCCRHEAARAEAPERAAWRQAHEAPGRDDCGDCDRVCCSAVVLALASTPSATLTPSTLSPQRGLVRASNRRRPLGLFRPPRA